MSRRRRWIFRIVVLVVTTELLCAGAQRILRKRRNLAYRPTQMRLSDMQAGVLRGALADKNTYVAHDGELGWTNRPNGTVDPYQANSLGLRADREYEPKTPAGKFRMACFGDSYVHADKVIAAESWTVMLETRNPKWEVRNAGVGGYGPGQAYLRYRRLGPKLDAQVVVIGYMSENINRAVNRFRPYYSTRTNIPLSKPRFVLDEGKLRLLPNPVADADALDRLLAGEPALYREMGVDDFWFRIMPRRGPFDFLRSVQLCKTAAFARRRHPDPESPLDPDKVYRVGSPALDVTVAILKTFYEEVRASGAEPVIVIFPHFRVLVRAIQGGPLAYEPLLKALEGLRVVDILEGFREFQPDYDAVGHYNAEGNDVVASYLGRYLLREGLAR